MNSPLYVQLCATWMFTNPSPIWIVMLPPPSFTAGVVFFSLMLFLCFCFSSDHNSPSKFWGISRQILVSYLTLVSKICSLASDIWRIKKIVVAYRIQLLLIRDACCLLSCWPDSIFFSAVLFLFPTDWWLFRSVLWYSCNDVGDWGQILQLEGLNWL